MMVSVLKDERYQIFLGTYRSLLSVLEWTLHLACVQPKQRRMIQAGIRLVHAPMMVLYGMRSSVPGRQRKQVLCDFVFLFWVLNMESIESHSSLDGMEWVNESNESSTFWMMDDDDYDDYRYDDERIVWPMIDYSNYSRSYHTCVYSNERMARRWQENWSRKESNRAVLLLLIVWLPTGPTLPGPWDFPFCIRVALRAEQISHWCKE